MFRGHAQGASSPAPQFESVERSISARGVFEFGSLTHRSESVERIISLSKRASGGQHAFGCARCL